MTKIEIYKDDINYVVNIEGHAMYNPGNDIVCAAISALACTLCAAVDDFDTYKEIDIANGHVHIEYEDINDYFKDRLNMIIKGFQMLEERYEKNVRCLVEI
jgi:uncharacterized protein YsxB (DUF464 family)